MGINKTVNKVVIFLEENCLKETHWLYNKNLKKKKKTVLKVNNRNDKYRKLIFNEDVFIAWEWFILTSTNFINKFLFIFCVNGVKNSFIQNSSHYL